MRRFVCVIMCIALCGCFISCSAESEEVALSNNNISEYVSVEVTFGEVNVADNESAIQKSKYYLTCLATITVKPKGDYAFTDASVSCVLDEGGGWVPIRTASGGKLTGIYFLYDWTGSVRLDKEGYGEKTVFLFCYSDTYDRMHPSSVNWECYALSASGTVAEN